MKKIIIIIILLLLLLYFIKNNKEHFTNYLLYLDNKDFYTRFLDRFHGMEPKYLYLKDYHNRPHFIPYNNNIYTNHPLFLYKMPHNLTAVRI